MNLRAWNYWVASAFLLGGMAVVAFNYFVDPYEVFGHHYLRSGHSVNERYRKVEHLLHDDVRSDSYILGSSVMGVYDPKVASRLSGRSFYNLSFLAGTPQEAFDTLRVLKRNGKPIKEVLIGVDFFTFYERPKGNAPMARPHPEVSGESRTSFFSSYLFASGVFQGLTRVAHHFQAKPAIFFDVDGSGEYHLYEYERNRVSDPAQYERDHFPANAWTGTEVHWIDERFDEFAALCSWLDENRIDAKIFIHPFYRETLSTISEKSYREFKDRILIIRPDVVDFSDSNAITSDKSWYYDKRHYRPVVADMIMASMYGVFSDNGIKPQQPETPPLTYLVNSSIEL